MAWCALCYLLIAAASAVSSQYAASRLTTVVGAPEVVGGPDCCVFDSPFLGIKTRGVVNGYTANDRTYVWSMGRSVDDRLPTPLFTGLGPDEGDNMSLSHCGKWLNAAFVADDGVVHGYFHQEWNCDYAHGGYTNKSIAYAVSSDGGLTFSPAPAPGPGHETANLIIAGQNFSSTHQTGEGDHGVARFGEWLYLLFIEWNGPESIHGGTSAGVARSSVADAGRPGTWWKYHAGAWRSPGVGGPSDAVDVPGSSLYAVPDVGLLVAIGVIFSAPLDVSWSADGVAWGRAAAGPMFTADWSSWDRTANSSELFGYPGLTGPSGTSDGLPTASAFVYFTYLAPGTDFSQRWLVRRPLQILAGNTTAPPALAALSLWTSPGRIWATSGPVAPPSGYRLAVPTLALLATWAPPTPAPVLLPLRECVLAPGVVALARDGECGVALAGKVLRTPGWVAGTLADAAALGWGHVIQPSTGLSRAAHPATLWRCRGGVGNYSVAFADPTCTSAGTGFVPDVLLGYALAPL